MQKYLQELRIFMKLKCRSQYRYFDIDCDDKILDVTFNSIEVAQTIFNFGPLWC